VRARRSFGLAWPGSAERFPVPLFSQELRVLLDAGLPLVEAIDTLAQKERGAGPRAVLERMCAVLRQGQPLSLAPPYPCAHFDLSPYSVKSLSQSL